MSGRYAIAIDPDLTPLDYERDVQKSAYPRVYRTIPIPLSFRQFGTLTVPQRMSANEWGTMLRFLDVVREGLIEIEPSGGGQEGAGR